MKTVYLKPSIKVIKIQTAKMIAVSQPDSNTVNVANKGNYNDAIPTRSRQGSIWDDEE